MLILRWNTWNVSHIAKHGVRPDEADEVVSGAKPPFPEKRPDGKYRIWGRTRSGRYLQVIYVYEDNDLDVDDQRAIEDFDLIDLIQLAEGALVVYVIHARELEADEKHQYRKRTGNH